MVEKIARGDREKSIRTTISLPTGDYEHLEQLAKRKKVSIAWVVRDAVGRYLSAELPLFREVR